MVENVELFQRLSIALAIGLLIGLERGWQAQDESEGGRTAGLRTNGLAGLLGGVWGAIAATGGEMGVIALALSFVVVGGTVAVFRLRKSAIDGTFGATSVIAAMLSFSLGAYAVLGDVIVAGAAGVAVVVVLASKSSLHGFLKRLTFEEFRSGLLLLAMTVILLPLLPNRPLDPFGALNPFRLWLMTIMIAAISFAGYVAVKAIGERLGILATGIAGGLVSSTAVTITMAKLAKEHPQGRNPLIAGALLASAVMAARVLVIVGVANIKLLVMVVLPIGLGGLVIAAAAILLLRFDGRDGMQQQALKLGNPFNIWSVLKFGALLTVITVLTKLAIQFGNPASTYVLAAISGIADVDAITLSMSQVGKVADDRQLAAIAILIVVASNTVSKTALGWITGGRAVGIRLAAVAAAALVAGAVGIAIGWQL